MFIQNFSICISGMKLLMPTHNIAQFAFYFTDNNSDITNLYREKSKNWDTENKHRHYPTTGTASSFRAVTNSEGPDQTAP